MSGEVEGVPLQADDIVMEGESAKAGLQNREEKKSLAGRLEDNASSSSWVVDMEKMLEDTNPSAEAARWEKRCIYRVPEYIKEMTNSKAYQPRFVSLGPLHHGEPGLLPMEQHKRRAVLHMVRRSGKSLGEFVRAIEEVADELEAAYDDLDDKWRGANRRSFVEVMVTDGCFLLELIRTYVKLLQGEEDDYGANDPVFGSRVFHNLWPVLFTDMIAMENQLPLLVLQCLLEAQLGTSPSAQGINSFVLLFLNRVEENMDSLGLHPLDIYHNSYCTGTSPHDWEGSDDYEARTGCAVELDEAGIHFKKSTTRSIHDIDFENSTLSMPLFNFNDDTEAILLNLMAFEWMHPDARHDLLYYISFVDKIINSERDVALLRSMGLIENMMSSDRKVVEIFNNLSKLAMMDRSSRLGHIQWKLNAHCRKRRNKWRASFVHTYLSNPWVFISLVAAIILLVVTVLQTVYTVVPFYTKG
ncbi:hypothetical protein ACP70R_008231 [Stipagrostis hirtigluma subsp. patula]